MRQRHRLTVTFGLAGVLCWSGCGARSDLNDLTRGRSTSSGEAGGTGTGAGGEGGALPQPCRLELAGEPIEVVRYAEGPADAPSLASVTAAGQPAVVVASVNQMANVWHPEMRLARVRASGAWPGSVVVDADPTLVGVDAHSWGRMTGLDDRTVGIAWYRGDEAVGAPSGLKFRAFDADAWSAHPEIFIDETADMTFQIAAGPTPAGNGFAVSHRAANAGMGLSPRVSFVNPQGALVPGPFLAAAREYPSLPAEVVWSGEHWIFAVPFDACVPGEPFCSPNTVVFGRIGADGVAVRTGQVAALPSLTPRRPWMVRYAGGLAAAWTEGPFDDAAPRTIRWIGLDALGAVQGVPEIVKADVPLAWSISLGASEAGAVLTWGEVVDETLPIDDPSHSALFVRHRDPTGETRTLEIPSSQFGWNTPSGPAVGWTAPRGFMIAWAAVNETQYSGIRLARLDCH